MNHQVIKDETLFREFIDWLPKLETNEKYYLSLFARKKYCEQIPTDKANLKRFATDKSRLWEKVRQLECAQGSYISKETPVPNEALALYISINPRCTQKASFQTIISLTQSIQNDNPNLNPHSEALTQLHKSPSRKNFVVFDVDRKEDLRQTMKTTRELIGNEAAHFVETRGGVHILIEVAKVKSHDGGWYPELHRRVEPDQTGDLLIPVPGCCQGGFTPHFVK